MCVCVCCCSYSLSFFLASIAYKPSVVAKQNYLYVAWEQGSKAKLGWVPAACSPYVRIDFATVMALE